MGGIELGGLVGHLGKGPRLSHAAIRIEKAALSCMFCLCTKPGLHGKPARQAHFPKLAPSYRYTPGK